MLRPCFSQCPFEIQWSFQAAHSSNPSAMGWNLFWRLLLIFIHLRFRKIFIKESFWTQPLQLFLLLWQKLKCQRKSILQIPNYFSHWQCEKMLIEEVNSIKSNLQTYKLHTLVKQFWLNWPYPNSKQFSNFQIDIFWHFKFCHDRRNGFCKSPKIDKDSRETAGARKWECFFKKGLTSL